jgi:hypothetical protein
MGVSTYNAVASRSYNGGYIIDDTSEPVHNVAFDVWASDNGLGQGRYSGWYTDSGYTYAAYFGPYYGTFHFGTGPAALAGKIIDSARLRLTRYSDSPGSSSGVTTTVYATNLTSVPGSGAHSPDGQVTGSGTTSPAMTKGQTVWFSIPVALAQAVIAGKCLCLYTGTGRLSRHYGIEGSSSQEPAIEITWHDPAPAPTTPTIGTIGTVTTDEKTFDCSDSSDSAGYFTSAQLMYEWQISYDNGTAWGDGITQDNNARITTAAGVSQHLINLRTALGLQPQQYYYNTQCKIRVRAKTPDYGGTPYYSAWATSAAFTINYKIVPSAPASLTPSKSDPYEGEEITFTVGRPSSYNTHDHNGDPMGIIYAVELANGAALAASEGADVDDGEVVIPYTVGELTAGDDLATTIRARATDAEGQVGPYLSGVNFTIKRWRAPVLTATVSGRTATGCQINVVVSDTGYGGTQSSDQIAKIQYKGAPGATDWTDATLNGAWGGSAGGFTNSFNITGLAAGEKYEDFLVRAINAPAFGSTGLFGEQYPKTILEYLPRLAAFKRDGATGDEAPAGAYMQSGIVGDNPDEPVDKGSFKIQHDLDVGGAIRRNGADVVTGTPGTSGNLAAWNADGDLVDSGIPTPGAWLTWTPTWTNVTVGSGTVTARYSKVGKRAKGELLFILGAGSAISGDIIFTLPVTAKTQVVIEGLFYDSSASARYPAMGRISGANADLKALNAAGTYLAAVSASATIPFTWASGDSIWCKWDCEEA